ncbi:NADPH:quinone reductase [Zavarzinella formosa]|uniref:NADPH:quinone reductase n=1 Tax=Zavarzinella formosa TaxID=360055 RepID=UPI0002D904EC|nr:NADPH:quinone reductase [Zavarzinella formosa]
MKAAYFEATGAPSVIQYGELPTPTPGPNEVRVKVTAVSVNPIDTYIRSGAVPANLPKPFIPGCDFAGTVDAVGAAVTKFKPGERVWGSNQGVVGRQGTFAEFCCPHEDYVYPASEGDSDEDLAAIALVGITAHLGLFMAAKTQAGEFVFVNGGTGGVGSMVVQMAKAVGAKVITTVGSEEKAKKAKALGADFVLNYKTDDIAAKVKEHTGGAGLHVFFETQKEPDYDKMVEMVRPRGRLVVIAGRTARPVFPHGPFYVKGLTLSGFAMFNMPPDEQRKCAADMSKWLAEGKLKANICTRLKLSEAAHAHQLQEESSSKGSGGLSGKIVLTTG